MLAWSLSSIKTISVLIALLTTLIAASVQALIHAPTTYAFLIVNIGVYSCTLVILIRNIYIKKIASSDHHTSLSQAVKNLPHSRKYNHTYDLPIFPFYSGKLIAMSLLALIVMNISVPENVLDGSGIAPLIAQLSNAAVFTPLSIIAAHALCGYIIAFMAGQRRLYIKRFTSVLIIAAGLTASAVLYSVFTNTSGNPSLFTAFISANLYIKLAIICTIIGLAINLIRPIIKSNISMIYTPAIIIHIGLVILCMAPLSKWPYAALYILICIMVNALNAGQTFRHRKQRNLLDY